MITLRFIIPLFFVLACGFAGAGVPAGGVPVIAPGPGAFKLVAEGGGDGTARMVPVAGVAFAEAWRIETRTQPANPWNIQLAAVSSAAVKRGDTLWVRFFMRCVASREESGEGRITIVFETADEAHEKSIDLTVGATAHWKEFTFAFVCRHDLPAGGAQVALRAGFRPQTVEIGGIALLNFSKAVKPSDLPRTTVDYPGRAAGAPWRRAAASRIERFRKGDFRVRILDPAGNPVPGARVNYSLHRHGFGFGSAIYSSFLLGEGPDFERYRDIVERCFPRVAFGNELKWPSWEQADDASRARTMASFDWLAARDIGIRGHVLVWPSWQYLPASAHALRDRPEELRRHAERHVRDMAGLTRGRFVDWDVINEPYAHNDLMRLLGDRVMVDWFKAARGADPGVKLFLNDYAGLANEGLDTPHKDHFEKTARFLKQNGAPIDGIGLQCHFGWSVTPPELALKELDRWAALGLEVQITEFDMETTDERLQADYTRDLLTLAFSHPAVTGVMIWGFWEGRHWKPDAALWRRDWSIKPNGRVWEELVTRQWHTAGEAVADAGGWISFRGFHGIYRFHATGRGKMRPGRAVLNAAGGTADVRLSNL